VISPKSWLNIGDVPTETVGVEEAFFAFGRAISELVMIYGT
jgi:hypothetical protein